MTIETLAGVCDGTVGRTDWALTMAPSLRIAGPRSICAQVVAVLLTALVVLLGTTNSSRAQSECTSAFERWSKLSAARTRTQPAAGGGHEACLPTEGVRADLLQALAKTRSICDAAPNQSGKQTKDMIDINASAIGTVPVCRAEPPPAREQPARQQPAKQQPAKEQQAATKAIEPEPAPVPQRVRQRVCLEVSPVGPDRFVFANHKCRGRSVLVVIEKKGPSGRIECKGYAITRQLTVATLKDARPNINYQCLIDEGGCNKAQVAAIFPECDW